MIVHRRGVKSLVLGSSHMMCTTGFAFMIWTNAWRALDALRLRQRCGVYYGVFNMSSDDDLKFISIKNVFFLPTLFNSFYKYPLDLTACARG
jgi:hypothetical protein